MWQWKPNTPPDELWHSAKGKTWSKHKYIRKEGNRYIYPEDVNMKSNRTKAKGRTTSELDAEANKHNKDMLNYQDAEYLHRQRAGIKYDKASKAESIADNLEREDTEKGTTRNSYRTFSRRLEAKQARESAAVERGLAAGAARAAKRSNKSMNDAMIVTMGRKLVEGKRTSNTHGGSGGNIDEAVNKVAKKKKRKENLKKHAKGIFYASGPVGKAAQSAENTYSLSKKAYDEEKKKKKNNTSLARR